MIVLTKGIDGQFPIYLSLDNLGCSKRVLREPPMRELIGERSEQPTRIKGSPTENCTYKVPAIYADGNSLKKTRSDSGCRNFPPSSPRSNARYLIAPSVKGATKLPPSPRPVATTCLPLCRHRFKNARKDPDASRVIEIRRPVSFVATTHLAPGRSLDNPSITGVCLKKMIRSSANCAGSGSPSLGTCNISPASALVCVARPWFNCRQFLCCS